MKIYIATAFTNVERYHEVKDKLEQLGHEITFDWTESKVADRKAATDDVRGVADANIVIGIFEEEYVYKGAIFELGFAYALAIPIFILGSWLDSMVFMHLAHIHKFSNLEDLIAAFEEGEVIEGGKK